jgi:hypothetical protein
VFLLDRFLIGLIDVLFTTISFSYCFELLFLACFSSCSFEMAEGFSRAFLLSGVSPGPITEVLGPDVPTLA